METNPLILFRVCLPLMGEMLRGGSEGAYVVDVVLVAVLDDGGLGELTIVGAFILLSRLARLATLL